MECNSRKSIQKQHLERLGMIKHNKQGCLMKVIEYINARNITVMFLDETKYVVKNKTWKEFDIGSIINPYYKSVYGIGYSGAKYPTKKNNKHTVEYILWHSMFVRCYSDISTLTRPTYENITIDKEWHNYEQFYEWIHGQENYDYYINSSERLCLDKDILQKNNKIYSPIFCTLVPERINKLFTKRQNKRGECPIGVHMENNRYIASCSNGSKDTIKYLGSYLTPQEAFLAYKKYKEKLIKSIALEEFNKGSITKKCFDSMNNYKVEISD